jgi:glycolate oxidase FAD binding subunit
MPVREAAALVDRATSEWGRELVRPATAVDAIAGAAPAVVLEPRDAGTLAAMLQWSDAERLAVVPRGAGTKQAWGGAPERADVVLSTRGLDKGVEHRADDLTATVPAGIGLAALNASLSAEGQWLPLDPMAADDATVGGVVATNDSGPRRLRYGTPRDLIIGIEVALVDGRTARAGGRVVKNVAGYDLSRLLCGSFGALGVVTSATFKLAPAPPASETLVATPARAELLAALAAAIAASPLTPTAVELETPAARLLVRFETTAKAATQQADAAAGLCRHHGAGVERLTPTEEEDVWRRHDAHVAALDGTRVKVSVLPTFVAAILSAAERAAGENHVGWSAVGRVTIGVLLVGLSGHPEGVARVVAALRHEARAAGGSAVLVHAPPAVSASVGPDGGGGDALPLARAVKARFDPNRTLNPGRGPGGL